MKPTYTYVSLFSGIEACSVAMSRIDEADFVPVFFSEIDPFPCAVLAHRFPGVPNLGDVTKIKVNPERTEITNGRTTIPFPRMGIDILAGGSPCQGFSVAGKRLGLDDPRSCLAMHYARLVEELSPRILLYENVPGMLSSAGGLDFYAFLRTLVNLGYTDISYRVLDAQYVTVDGSAQDSYPHAVPQRRKRVWLVGMRSVGRSGDTIPASAQILFERPGLLGNNPPRRETREAASSHAGRCAVGDDRVVEGAGRTGSIGGGGRDDVSEVLTARGFKGIGARNGDICGPFVADGRGVGIDRRMKS